MHVVYLDSTNEAPPHMQAIVNSNGGFEGNSGNDGYSSEAMALINCAGGLNIPEFVSPGNKPSANFQGDQDNTVPYGCARAQGGSTPVRLCGLGVIEPLYQQYGINHVSVVYPGDGHVPWDGNIAKFTKLDTTAANFLYDMMCNTSTSINDIAEEDNIQIYPNPVNQELKITFKSVSEYVKVQLMDITGRLIEQKEVVSAEMNFVRNQQPSGIYFVRLVKKDLSSNVKKIVFE